MLGSSWVAAQFAASQEGLGSMKLVIYAHYIEVQTCSSTLMVETEDTSETLGFITTLTRIITSEDFNKFIPPESFESYYK
jgi:hypothetical protein